MGNDKSFYTLLNKYNTLLAQTQDLKEQLDKSKENNAEILQKDKVIEKNLRDLCADILAKDPKEMKLGQEYSWDKIDLLSLIQKSRNVFKKYNEDKKNFLEQLADTCEDRGRQIENLKSQIEELLMNPAARSLTPDQLQAKCEKIEKDAAVIKKMNPEVKKSVENGKINLIHEEDTDPMLEEEEEAYQNIEILNQPQEKITANSIPGTSARKKIQDIKKRKKPIVAMENYQDTLNQLDEESKLVMRIIGEKGISQSKDILMECVQQDQGLSNARLRSSLKFLKGLQILTEEELRVWAKISIFYFTPKGRKIYELLFDEKPTLSEAEKLLAEHTSLTHGYGILKTAELIRAHNDFISVNEWNRKNPIQISAGSSYIPDIICETAGGRKFYIEYECANHTQVNFNAKCNKMLSVSTILNFIVPNRAAEEAINSQIRQWIINKGREAISHATIRVTTIALIADVNLIENKSWHFVYNLSKSEVPEVN